MAEFKVVVNDTKHGTSYTIPVSGHHANSLIGKKINEEVDGIFVSLPGYKLQITGGTDKNGFPMRKDLSGSVRRRLLLSESLGFHPKENGKRKKKSVRGNTINQEIVQINMKVVKTGAKPIKNIIETQAKKEDGEQKPEEGKEKPAEKEKETTEEQA